MLSKQGNNENGFTLIELIIVIVILGIIAGVAIPKFVGLSDEARISAARGAGGAMSSTIIAKHADYLINTNAYAATDIVNDTLFVSGLPTPTVAGNVITLISGPSTFNWTYTPRNGVDSAYVTEDSSSAFP
jgi:MSHA pilin protein MshA